MVQNENVFVKNAREEKIVTIKDIAKRCGVSPSTVSKALNNYGDVSQETINRVRQAAKELNYRPNAAARTLKTNRSYDIGILFVDDTMCGLTHQYFSAILNSAKTVFEASGYSITFISPTVGGRPASFLESARYRNCDGVLIASIDFSSESVVDLLRSEIPTLTIDYDYPGCSCVMSDNVDGGFALTKHLIDMGHRKIGLIHGENTLVTRKRVNGFYRAMREAGIPVPEEYVLEGVYSDPNSTADATVALMSLPDPPTAIMYPDDFSYIGGRNALERLGLRIPEDVSAVGYDGIMLSQVLRPALTTWYQDAEEIGRASAKKLIEEIEAPDTSVPEQILVHGQLLVGRSVKNLSE